MPRLQLPAHIQELNARLTANPALTATMAPVHLLSVRGRASGMLRSTPVSPLSFEQQRWLVAGWADADWVKNLRASGWGLLRQGSRVERIEVVEVPPEHRARVLQAFVQQRGGGRFAFDLSPDAPLDTFAAMAERYPIFRIVQAEPVEAPAA